MGRECGEMRSDESGIGDGLFDGLDGKKGME